MLEEEFICYKDLQPGSIVTVSVFIQGVPVVTSLNSAYWTILYPVLVVNNHYIHTSMYLFMFLWKQPVSLEMYCMLLKSTVDPDAMSVAMWAFKVSFSAVWFVELMCVTWCCSGHM